MRRIGVISGGGRRSSPPEPPAGEEFEMDALHVGRAARIDTGGEALACASRSPRGRRIGAAKRSRAGAEHHPRETRSR